ncbi:MAG TPA: pilus assembly protein TadG-related protein [Sphingomicrobium sp.]|nr:pilus assembly protein TadG-related protein [Sphingomicrobium sp.]
MTGFFKKLWRDKRGNALVIAAAALPLVIGSAGLASDTIQWALWKRQLQRAADSGAIAGVYAIVQDEGSRGNVTTAVDRDLTHNSHIGYTTTKVVGAPTSGSYTADPYAVQVQLSVQKKLSFSGMFMSYIPTITATATATVTPSGNYCVVSLEDTSTTGITMTGNATVNLGCGMITNSTSMTAAVATGSSAVTSSPIAAVGGIAASNNWGSGTILQPFTLAQEDPFKNVPPPPMPSSGNCPQYRKNNQNQGPWTFSATDANTSGLPAGYYCVSDIDINSTVTFPSDSVIIIDGGNFNIGGQAHVSCTRCTFVLTSRDAATNPADIGVANINGGAELDLVANNSGTYSGLIIYQDRRAIDDGSANTTNLINGNSDSSFQGAFYFPSQRTTVNGTAGMSTACVKLVARRVDFSGNMNISNTCPSNSGVPDFTGKKVRLVE